MRRYRTLRSLAAAAVGVATVLATLPVGAAEKTLTVWSHFADHQGARAFFRDVEQILESENPDIDLKMTFYEKKALFAAQMTALRAGEGPDVIYLEPDRIQFIESGFVTPLDGLVDLDRLHDFAKEAWTVDGKVYALGMQAFTVELYYDKKNLEKVLKAAGMDMPAYFETRLVPCDPSASVLEFAAPERPGLGLALDPATLGEPVIDLS